MLIRDSEDSFLIVDASVQEKPYAKAIELVAAHYRGCINKISHFGERANLRNMNRIEAR
jgi:hypothetical protein